MRNLELPNFYIFIYIYSIEDKLLNLDTEKIKEVRYKKNKRRKIPKAEQGTIQSND